MFGILTAIEISLLGWLAQNYDEARLVLLIVALTIIVISTIGIVIVNKKAYSKIRQLKDL
ncbi:MAG: hypothetical protein U9N42_10515 [Campylobacterota bacterium]|nr:hypothetical protein [Campylobacterota bacterium]